MNEFFAIRDQQLHESLLQQYHHTYLGAELYKIKEAQCIDQKLKTSLRLALMNFFEWQLKCISRSDFARRIELRLTSKTSWKQLDLMQIATQLTAKQLCLRVFLFISCNK